MVNGTKLDPNRYVNTFLSTMVDPKHCGLNIHILFGLFSIIALKHCFWAIRGYFCVILWIQRVINLVDEDLRALLINCQILTIYIDSNSVILPCTIMIKEALLKWYNVIILQIGQGHCCTMLKLPNTYAIFKHFVL